MSDNDLLLDAAVLQSIRSIRFQNSEAKSITKKLFESDKDLRLLLNTEDLIGYTSQRGRVLRGKVRDLLRTQHRQEIKPAIVSAVDGISILSANAEAAVITRVAPVALDVLTPSAGFIKAFMRNRPFNGGILSDWISLLERNDIERVFRRIQQGMIDGEATEAIVQGVLGTRSLAYRDGMRHVTRTGAEMLVRTAINHASSSARMALWQQNSHIIKAYQWVSVLDTNTSAICRSRDGKVWKLGGGPIPPAHPNCRSTIAALMKGAAARKVTYNDWLVRQPDSVIREALGPKRFDLWEAGDFDVGDFINDKGIRLTLDELQALA